MPNMEPQYSTSIQSYPGVHVKEVGVVIPVAEDKSRKMTEMLNPLTHMTHTIPSLAWTRSGVPKEYFAKKAHFGRTKGYFGGFVDDCLKGANQQDDVEGIFTWSNAMKNQKTPSGMSKPFHPAVGPMTKYMHEILRAGHKNPFTDH